MICLGAFLFGKAQDNNKGIKFETGKFSEILAKAKAEDKLVFMDIYATWCPPCKQMAKNVFPLEKVGNYFNKGFVNAKFDAEKGEGVALAKKYKVTAYPTLLLINSSGELVGKLVGGQSPDALIAKIEALKVKALKK